MKTYIRVMTCVAIAGFALAGVEIASAKGGPPQKVTICHVAGLASDPANYITLTLPENAVYGQAGHFNENGTPNAGHEQDYLGPCVVPDPEPTCETDPSLCPVDPPDDDDPCRVPLVLGGPTCPPPDDQPCLRGCTDGDVSGGTTGGTEMTHARELPHTGSNTPIILAALAGLLILSGAYLLSRP